MQTSNMAEMALTHFRFSLDTEMVKTFPASSNGIEQMLRNNTYFACLTLPFTQSPWQSNLI